MKKQRCYNCKHGGQQFKIGKLTHLHCEDNRQYTEEGMHNGDWCPWDTLRVFSDSCDMHEFKI